MPVTPARRGIHSWRITLGLALLAPLLLAIVAVPTGRINVGDGQGWDGADYAQMVDAGWRKGAANTALRPFVVALTRPAYLALGRDPVLAFRVMNYVYVTVLALALVLLASRIGADTGASLLLVTNLGLCIATAKFIAFYPVLIDAGAYAVVALAVLAIVSGRRVPAALACVAAVLSREFAVAVVVFGVHRDLRLRVPLGRTVLTYLPAAATFVAWRMIVAHQWAAAGGGGMVTLDRLLGNLELWRDPVFVLLFAYFSATVFGGISLFVASRPLLVARFLALEHEWLSLAAAVLAPAAMGHADMWRYLAYLLPLVTVCYAVAIRTLNGPARWGVVVATSVATLVTQRPWQVIDLPAYFRDWFPYYVQVGNVPVEPLPTLWPIWTWRLVGVPVLVALLAVSPVVATTWRGRRG